MPPPGPVVVIAPTAPFSPCRIWPLRPTGGECVRDVLVEVAFDTGDGEPTVENALELALQGDVVGPFVDRRRSTVEVVDLGGGHGLLAERTRPRHTNHLAERSHAGRAAGGELLECKNN